MLDQQKTQPAREVFTHIVGKNIFQNKNSLSKQCFRSTRNEKLPNIEEKKNSIDTNKKFQSGKLIVLLLDHI